MKPQAHLILNLICVVLLFWVVGFFAVEDLDYFNPWGSAYLEGLWKIALPILLATIILSINIVTSMCGKRNP